MEFYTDSDKERLLLDDGLAVGERREGGLATEAAEGQVSGGGDQRSNGAWRSPFRRDFARVVHSASFRRLQGKTQLFYGDDAVFRNRLTHSLEVAQIAKSIALRLNATVPEVAIDPDVCEVAGLAHDLGHPPFGHNGERALDDFMKMHGGFEGNAQTLRVLMRLDKRSMGTGIDRLHGISEDGADARFGMNLTRRSLASVLKYHHQIPYARRKGEPVVKGFYHDEADRVAKVVEGVLGSRACEFQGVFKTVECSIMDIADDIAYSTYDLEDAWKAGLVGPMDLIDLPPTRLGRVADKVRREKGLAGVTDKDVEEKLAECIVPVLVRLAESVLVNQAVDGVHDVEVLARSSRTLGRYAGQVASSSRMRTGVSSGLVDEFVESVRIDVDNTWPQMSRVYLTEPAHLKVSALKHFTFVEVIERPNLRIPEFRGYAIIRRLARAVMEAERDGVSVLPGDFRETLESIPLGEEGRRRRLVADFVAGMTDAYAANFYNRLVSDYPTTVFGPSL